MEVLITIVEFLAVLAVVVLVHEFGHFATAKAFGIKVNEFGFGFPPRLLGVRKGETVYTVNLIPIGGFVKMEGENDPSQPRSLASKGVSTRFIVLVAGVFMNVVLAIVLFAGFFMFTAPQEVEELRVGTVSPGSPAELAGVLPGDVILEVNGTRVNAFDELRNQIFRNRGEEIELLIQREDTQHRARMVPRVDPPAGEGPTGISRDLPGIRVVWYARHPWEAVALGAERTWVVPGLLKDAITDWITDDGEIPFAGPVGIAQGTGEISRELGRISLIPLAALLSISLAILNILPIPALDGGRILFVILEWVRQGKRIPPEKEGFVHLVGFVVLIVLVLGPLTYRDIVRLVEGNSLLR